MTTPSSEIGSRRLDLAGTRDFATPEEAEASPLAEAMFDLGDVTGVFFGSDFVSVTATPGTDWSVLKPDILGLLLDHFTAQMPLFRQGSAAGFSVPAEDVGTDDPADADIVAQIRELIDTRVRPAVANDGGDIVYRGFDKGKVFLQLQGACAGCPSSSATTTSSTPTTRSGSATRPSCSPATTRPSTAARTCRSRSAPARTPWSSTTSPPRAPPATTGPSPSTSWPRRRSRTGG